MTLSADVIVNEMMRALLSPGPAVVCAAGGCVGPMMKLPLLSAGGTVPSGNSVARG